MHIKNINKELFDQCDYLVAHASGDHKYVFTLDHKPAGLIPDKKGRQKGKPYVKEGEKIYDVTIGMYEHPSIKDTSDPDKPNDLVDIWVGGSADQKQTLMEAKGQLSKIKSGKGGGTKFIGVFPGGRSLKTETVQAGANIKMALIISSLDHIASKIEETDPIVSLALDFVSDRLENIIASSIEETLNQQVGRLSHEVGYLTGAIKDVISNLDQAIDYPPKAERDLISFFAKQKDTLSKSLSYSKRASISNFIDEKHQAEKNKQYPKLYHTIDTVRNIKDSLKNPDIHTKIEAYIDKTINKNKIMDITEFRILTGFNNKNSVEIFISFSINGSGVIDKAFFDKTGLSYAMATGKHKFESVIDVPLSEFNI